jgi:hypothetical protein
LTFGIAAFVFWQPATTSSAIQETYKQRSKNVSIAPPSWYDAKRNLITSGDLGKLIFFYKNL